MSLSNCVPHLCILAPAEKTLRVSRVGAAGPLHLTRGPATGGREGGWAPSCLVLGGRVGQRRGRRKWCPDPTPGPGLPSACHTSLSHGCSWFSCLCLSLLEVTLRKARLVSVCFSCSHFIGGYTEATKGPPRGAKHVGPDSQSPRNCRTVPLLSNAFGTCPFLNFLHRVFTS